MKIKSKVLIAAVALALSQGVFAQTAPESGFYLGGSIGRSSVDLDNAQTRNTLTAAGFTNNGVTSDDKSSSWKLFGGYQINRNFAAELGFHKLGDFTQSTTVTAVGGVAIAPTNVTAKVEDRSTFSLSVLAMAPFGPVSVFGKLGAYTSDVKISASAGGRTLSNHDRDNDWLYGAGVSYNINRNFAVRGEWERFLKVGTNDQTGQGDVDVWSVGVTFKF